MRERALEEAIMGKRSHVGMEFAAAEAGADAERARVVAWLHAQAEKAKTGGEDDAWAAFFCAAIDIRDGEHWESGDGRG